MVTSVLVPQKGQDRGSGLPGTRGSEAVTFNTP